MTREDARKAAEVMMAYADGKEVEFREIGEPYWECVGKFDADDMGFDFSDFEYRVKKDHTYRPFKDKDECWNEMLKHQPFGWAKHKRDGTLTCFTCICDENDFIYFYEDCTFADGTPFGIKEE